MEWYFREENSENGPGLQDIIDRKQFGGTEFFYSMGNISKIF